MTRNEQYWIDRANRRMDGYQISAIKQAKIINRSYNQTCNYVQSEIAKILRHIGDEDSLAYEYRMKRLNALLAKTQKKMQELKDKIDTLLTELDTQIKVSNATTPIEF